MNAAGANRPPSPHGRENPQEANAETMHPAPLAAIAAKEIKLYLRALRGGLPGLFMLAFFMAVALIVDGD